MIAQELAATLQQIAAELRSARDPWWLFGSAAVVLYGLEPVRVKDVDVIVSAADAGRMMAAHGLENLADGGRDKFRSDIMLHPGFGAMPVEILSGFHIRDGDIWYPVRPQTRVEIRLGPGVLYVPSRGELAAIFRRCGRLSDLDHAKMLDEAEVR